MATAIRRFCASEARRAKFAEECRGSCGSLPLGERGGNRRSKVCDIAATCGKFWDRHDAGRRLGGRLLGMSLVQPIVVALPRGGVLVAVEVSLALSTPMGIYVVRKVGFPAQPELALGAIGQDGSEYFDTALMAKLGVRASKLAPAVEREKAALATRVSRYGSYARMPDAAKRTVIIVDDGVATGATLRVAISAMRSQGAARVVVAVPVGAPGALADLAHLADEVVFLLAPGHFGSVSQSYQSFGQVSDDDVLAALGG